MKISEVTAIYIAEYLRIDATEETATINVALMASINYIKGFTGLDDTMLDTHEDLTIVLLIICAEFFDNRQLTVQYDKQNPVVKQILSMHSINLL